MKNIKELSKKPINQKHINVVASVFVGIFAFAILLLVITKEQQFVSTFVAAKVYAQTTGNIDNAANEGITLYNISNFTVTDNQVYGNYEEGIDVKNGTNGGVVANNTVYDNNGPNIYADGANNVKIYANTVYGARGASKAGIACAVESGGNAQDLFIFNNLIYNNKGGGIDCWTGHYSNVQIYNNTIYNNTRGGILATSGVVTNSVARNNIIFNNTNNTVIGSGFTADHNLFTDPALVSASDFHLKAGSAAIDKGISDSGAPATDFAGAVRPNGSAVDIGAYEYGGIATGPTIVPTSPSSTGGTKFSLTLKMHGIGKGGDNVNATGQGNFNLQRPQRNVILQVYNAQNQLVATKTGTVTFNASTGLFNGTIDMGTLPSGSYSIKVKADQFLRAAFAGIPNITAASTNQLPQAVLVSGDINNDNFLNIVDYNIMMGCYSDFQPAENCVTSNKTLSDLNDDGVVNQFDYNLFIREVVNAQGQ